MRLIDGDNARNAKFPTVPEGISEAYVKGWNDAIDAIVENAQTVTPNMAQVLAYESGKSSERKKTYKDLCDTCKRGDFCELSTKKIFCSYRTTQCSQYKRRGKNDPN